MKQIAIIKKYVFYLVLFTLPMYTIINNILLVVFFALFIIEGNFKRRFYTIKKNYSLFIPLGLFFMLALFAALNPFEGIGVFLKGIEKYWSLILIPITFISCKEEYTKDWKNLFLALLWGCIATLSLCYANAIYEMIVGNEPLHYFWRWRHLNHQFTAIADTHPAYLGLYIVTSIVFLFMESSYKKWTKIILCVILFLGLIQLASRTALLSLSILVVFLIWTKIKTHWKEIGITFSVLVLIGALFMGTASSFLKERLVSFQNLGKDQRISRFKISYDIFTEYPIFGVGNACKEEVRKKKYLENNFQTAALEKYNAHNQFLEYLSVNGIIGAIVFLSVFAYLLFICWRKKQYFFLTVLLLFLVANITESMLVRIKGIEFFAFTVSLLIILKNKEETSE